MNRLIKIWLLVSVFATAGIYAYVQFADQFAPNSTQSVPQVTGSSGPSRPTTPRSIRSQGQSDETRVAEAASGEKSQSTEQLALMISIGSSIISALAAVMQTWLTHRSIRAGR